MTNKYYREYAKLLFKPSTNLTSMEEIIVIGAGLAGSLTALELAELYNVLLIEAGDEVLPPNCTSLNESKKLHLGLHYIGDLNTAEHCLLQSILFVRANPQFISGGDDLFSPCRRGRHFIMSNSLTHPNEAVRIANHLQNIYRQKVAEDPANKVFGEPEDFIRFLERKDYAYLADTMPYYNQNGQQEKISIALGIETAESQVDMNRLKKHIQQKINNHPNITVLTNTEVKNIAHNRDTLGYTLTLQKGNAIVKRNCEMAISCAWQNNELLHKNMEQEEQTDNYINRIKVSVLIRLKRPLRNINTCIFSSGAYGSVTIWPDGTAIITSERLTNVGFYPSDQEPPAKLKQLLGTLNLNCPEGLSLAQHIISDCANYFADAEKALFLQSELIQLQVGYVKLIDNEAQYNDKALYRKDSIVHERVDDGVRESALGYIVNAGIKMCYTVGNAQKVKALVDSHKNAIEIVKKLSKGLKNSLHPILKNSNKSNLDWLINVHFKARLFAIAQGNEATFDDKLYALRNDILQNLHQNQPCLNNRLRSSYMLTLYDQNLLSQFAKNIKKAKLKQRCLVFILDKGTVDIQALSDLFNQLLAPGFITSYHKTGAQVQLIAIAKMATRNVFLDFIHNFYGAIQNPDWHLLYIEDFLKRQIHSIYSLSTKHLFAGIFDITKYIPMLSLFFLLAAKKTKSNIDICYDQFDTFNIKDMRVNFEAGLTTPFTNEARKR